MKFKSKIGLEIVIPLILIFGSIGWNLFNDRLWIGLAIVLSVFVFIMFIFSTTYYVIEKNALLVRCSFFFSCVIDIHAITQISETHSPLSAPAASLDRLEISYGTSKSIIISPRDKKVFMAKILEINPNVVISLRA